MKKNHIKLFLMISMSLCAQIIVSMDGPIQSVSKTVARMNLLEKRREVLAQQIALATNENTFIEGTPEFADSMRLDREYEELSAALVNWHQNNQKIQS